MADELRLEAELAQAEVLADFTQFAPQLPGERFENIGGARPLERIARVVGRHIGKLDIDAAALAQELEPAQPGRLREDVLVLGELERQTLDRDLGRLIDHRRVHDLSRLLAREVLDRRMVHEARGVAAAYARLVEPAPVADDGRLAQRERLLPPARVLIGDEVARVDMAPDLARIGLRLRRRGRGAKVGTLDEGELAKLLRLLVLFAKLGHRALPCKRSAALSITSQRTRDAAPMGPPCIIASAR